MTLQQQVRFWLIAFAVLAGVLYLLHGIMLPFVAGLALAYFLDPVVSRLERMGVSRIWGTVIVTALFLLVFTVSIVLLAPLLANQLTAFVARLPGYVQQLQALFQDQNREWLQSILGDKLPDVSKSVGDIVSNGVSFIGSFLQSLLTGGAAVISLVSLLVVTPVVAFYLLADWKDMITAVDHALPRKNAETIRQIARDIDQALSGFVRGQTTVCIVLAIYYGVGLSLSGLNYGLLIGILTGMFSFVPYVGSLTGLLLAAGIGFVQFWPDWSRIILVLAVFGAGQFLEGNFLSPKLVGRSVGLHPVWLMFALFAFGTLFGFVGLLLAVPLAAAVGVLTRFALAQYLNSPLYTGTPRGSEPPDGGAKT